MPIPLTPYNPDTPKQVLGLIEFELREAMKFRVPEDEIVRAVESTTKPYALFQGWRNGQNSLPDVATLRTVLRALRKEIKFFKRQARAKSATP